MNLNLFQNNSDTNVVWKQITPKTQLQGTLREDCSIIDPIIKVQGIGASDLPFINYCEIVEFGRYYYIKDIVCVGNLYELRCHIDVLMTYKDQIKNIPAIIERQENNFNLYLQDGLLKEYANSHQQIIQFPNGFNQYEYIFSVCG